MGDESRQRQSYSPQTRLRAGEMYALLGMSVKEIHKSTGIPAGTLGRWQSEDEWDQNVPDETGKTFAQTCEYLMRTIHRLSLRLYESTFLPDFNDDDNDDDDDEKQFVLPDENLELRINRLTLALERIMPMGNLLLTKQRIDVTKEIKQHGFDCVSQKVFTDEEMMIAFRVVEHYLDTLEVGRKK